MANSIDPLQVRVLRSAEQFDHDLCRRLAGEAYPALPTMHGAWPDSWADAELYRQNETLVAIDDGLVVGRAILEARYQPCCELVNLAVRPDYRRRGAATAIVREAITRARSMGFKYMFLQESLQDAEAHGLYLKAGFLTATRGDMQRMVRLLDVPIDRLPSARRPPLPGAAAVAAQLAAWSDDRRRGDRRDARGGAAPGYRDGNRAGLPALLGGRRGRRDRRPPALDR